MMVADFFPDMSIPQHGVHLVLHGPNDKPTGEAFVEVMTEDDVEKALNRSGAAMGSRYIEVFRSSMSDMTRLESGTAGMDYGQPVHHQHHHQQQQFVPPMMPMMPWMPPTFFPVMPVPFPFPPLFGGPGPVEITVGNRKLPLVSPFGPPTIVHPADGSNQHAPDAPVPTATAPETSQSKPDAWAKGDAPQ